MTVLGVNDVRLFPVPTACSPNPADVVLTNPRRPCAEIYGFGSIFPDALPRAAQVQESVCAFVFTPPTPPPPPPTPPRPTPFEPAPGAKIFGFDGYVGGGPSWRYRVKWSALHGWTDEEVFPKEEDTRPKPERVVPPSLRSAKAPATARSAVAPATARTAKAVAASQRTARAAASMRAAKAVATERVARASSRPRGMTETSSSRITAAPATSRSMKAPGTTRSMTPMRKPRK